MSKMTLYPAFGSTNRYDNYTHYHICYTPITKKQPSDVYSIIPEF